MCIMHTYMSESLAPLAFLVQVHGSILDGCVQIQCGSEIYGELPAAIIEYNNASTKAHNTNFFQVSATRNIVKWLFTINNKLLYYTMYLPSDRCKQTCIYKRGSGILPLYHVMAMEIVCSVILL
jgi:hypothetical protein